MAAGNVDATHDFEGGDGKQERPLAIKEREDLSVQQQERRLCQEVGAVTTTSAWQPPRI